MRLDGPEKSAVARTARIQRWRLKLARWGFVVVPALALAELAAHVYFAHRAPDEAQWREAREPIVSMRRSGDLVTVAPQWAEPIARMTIGDELMPLRDVARADETRYETALEISILGERSPWCGGWTELERRTVGKFTVRRLRNPQPQRVNYDFVDHLGPQDATATIQGGRGEACTWTESANVIAGGLGGMPTFPAQRFICPGPAHVFVGVTVIEDKRYLPRRCVMMHPSRAGKIAVTFGDVPLGSVIRGHMAMRWLLERDQAGAPVLLEVLVNDDKIGETVHADGDGWKSWTMSLGAHAGSRGRVTFRVSSARPANRPICWEADTR